MPSWTTQFFFPDYLHCDFLAYVWDGPILVPRIKLGKKGPGGWTTQHGKAMWKWPRMDGLQKEDMHYREAGGLNILEVAVYGSHS